MSRITKHKFYDQNFLLKDPNAEKRKWEMRKLKKKYCVPSSHNGEIFDKKLFDGTFRTSSKIINVHVIITLKEDHPKDLIALLTQTHFVINFIH